jgi:hypothetical protein
MRFLRLSTSDKIWTASYAFIAGLVFLLLSSQGVSSLVGAALVVLWMLSMLTPETNQDERIYQMPLSFIQDALMSLQKDIWSQSKKEPRGKRAIKPFPLEVREFGDVGLVYNQIKRTYSMIITSEGSPISSMSMLGQYAAVQSLASLVTKAAATAGRGGLKIAMGLRARPQDPWLVPNTLNEVADINVILPSALATHKPESEWTNDDKRAIFLNKILESYADIVDLSASVEMILVVTVKDTDEFRRAFKEGVIYDKEMRNQSITRIRNVIIPYLERLIGDVTVLDGEGAEKYLRKAWDVVTLNDYYLMAQKRLMGTADAEGTLTQYLPASHIKAYPDCVEIDGTFATTLKITSFPFEEVYAHRVQEVYDSMARWSSTSVIGETLHSGREYNILNGLTGLTTDAADRFGVIRSGPRAERRDEERIGRLREMDNAVYNQDFVPVVAVLAGSREELMEEYGLEADRLTAAGYSHIRVLGRSKQLPSFLTATTLIDLE